MSTNPGPGNAVLSLQHVSKRFGAVQALQGVSVECRAGEIHAVVGENGSGKSTLLGIASGYLAPDEGIVEIGGERLNAAHAADAWRLGLRMRLPDLFAPPRAVGGGEPVPCRSSPATAVVPFDRAVGCGSAERVRRRPSPGAAVGTLSLGERQMLEVGQGAALEAKGLASRRADDCARPGRDRAPAPPRSRRAAEGVGIVYVSHRLPEVLEISDRVTVLRDGQGQGTYDAAQISENDLVALMIGRPLQLAFPERNDDGRTEVLLDVAGLHGRGSARSTSR